MFASFRSVIFRSKAGVEETKPVLAHDSGDFGFGKAVVAKPVQQCREMPVVLKPFRHRREPGLVGTSFTVVYVLRPPADPHPFDHAVRLVLAQVGADPDMFWPHQFSGAGDHSAEIRQRAIRSVLQMVRIKGKSQHATGCGKFTQNVV